ncbi:FAD:protein FMN transferase [Myxococcota bacterium]|nr:FAD:protein FMN transferase [Myxococcota bacterium]
MLPALFLAALFGALWLRRPPEAPPPPPDPATTGLRLSGLTMGTTWHATVSGPADGARAHQAVQAALDAVDARMSTYKPESELSVLNRAPGGQDLPVSPELAQVLAIALEVGRESGGTFDVTVKSLVDAWGFGPPDAPSQAPPEEQLARMRLLVGPDQLRLDPAASTVRKASDGVQVDLSAVAKGHGVDRAFEALAALGYADLMVEVGGEVRARGQNPDGQPWRVGVERPDGDGGVLQAVALPDGAMATSGDYRNYREVDGQRISHTIDPRTGRPITHGLASVSVLQPSCAWADAWATALNVLGPVDGPALAQAQGLPALFVVRQGTSFSTTHSATWPTPLPAPAESP